MPEYKIRLVTNKPLDLKRWLQTMNCGQHSFKGVSIEFICDSFFGSNDPNVIGELLRDQCFAQSYGCYSCFELTSDFFDIIDKELVRELSSGMFGGIPHFEEDLEYFNQVCERAGSFYTNGVVNIAWFWDGDGTLLFHDIESDKAVVNHDCKKCDRWEWVKL